PPGPPLVPPPPGPSPPFPPPPGPPLPPGPSPGSPGEPGPPPPGDDPKSPPGTSRGRITLASVTNRSACWSLLISVRAVIVTSTAVTLYCREMFCCVTHWPSTSPSRTSRYLS